MLEKLSDEQPLAVLRAGGLEAMLQFIDFFALPVQRQAVGAAAGEDFALKHGGWWGDCLVEEVDGIGYKL